MQPLSARAEVIQVGILVEDVEKAASKLEKLIGIGPFEIFEPDFRDLTLHGKTARYKIRLGLASAGPVQVELMQVLHGDSIYQEFHQRKGYGLHHLAIRTDNMERSIKEMEGKGFRPIQSGNRPGVKWAYFDTEGQTDVVFELIQREQTSPS